MSYAQAQQGRHPSDLSHFKSVGAYGAIGEPSLHAASPAYLSLIPNFRLSTMTTTATEELRAVSTSSENTSRAK